MTKQLDPISWKTINGFTESVLAIRYDDPKPVPPHHLEMWELCTSENPQVAIAAPRGSAKSTAVTFAYVLASVLFEEHAHVLLISANEELASGFLNDIKVELQENEILQTHPALGIKKFIKERETEIIVEKHSGFRFRIIVKGAEQRMRGLKWERKRPSMVVCHKKGTIVETEYGYHKVEEHPTANEVKKDGYDVRVHGLPYQERVTPEHRYWGVKKYSKQQCKMIDGKKYHHQEYTTSEEDWIEAQNLDKVCYIGQKIDTEILTPQPIEYDSRNIVERDEKGRVITAEAIIINKLYPWFDQDEFWWMVGLWWGDGHLTKDRVGVTIADKQKDIIGKRLEDYLKKNNKPFVIVDKEEACYQLLFSDRALSRWLKKWKHGNSRKEAPEWVLKLDHEKQKNIIHGYIDADGFVDYKNQQVRLTSIHYPGLIQVQKILARLNVPSSIRHGLEPSTVIIRGQLLKTQKKYDLRFKENASILGYDIQNQTRYGIQKCFIENGFLWRKVKETQYVEEDVFIPIKAESHTYNTEFGLSHNCDDLEDEELVSSELRREKFRRWFYGAVKPIIRDGGKIRVVGTVMHMDSLLMRLMPPMKGKETVFTPLKMSTTEKRAWKSVLYRAHDEDFKNLLWPEMYSEERLRAIRKDFAEQGMLDVYGQEYLNDPIDQTTAYFRKEDFIPMEIEDFQRFKTFYCAGDLAITENKRSAFTALGAGGMDSDGVLHLEDVRRGRWDSLEISDEIFSLARRFEPDTFRLEAENIQRSIGPFLFKRMDDEQHYINIDAKPPTKDKLARAQSIRARMRAGKVKFNKEAEWYADFEEELLHFPKWPYKDQVDMFAWMGLMLDEMTEAPTDEEYTEAWLEEEEEDFEYTGICNTTGY